MKLIISMMVLLVDFAISISMIIVIAPIILEVTTVVLTSIISMITVRALMGVVTVIIRTSTSNKPNDDRVILHFTISFQ